MARLFKRKGPPLRPRTRRKIKLTFLVIGSLLASVVLVVVVLLGALVALLMAVFGPTKLQKLPLGGHYTATIYESNVGGGPDVVPALSFVVKDRSTEVFRSVTMRSPSACSVLRTSSNQVVGISRSSRPDVLVGVMDLNTGVFPSSRDRFMAEHFMAQLQDSHPSRSLSLSRQYRGEGPFRRQTSVQDPLFLSTRTAIVPVSPDVTLHLFIATQQPGRYGVTTPLAQPEMTTVVVKAHQEIHRSAPFVSPHGTTPQSYTVVRGKGDIVGLVCTARPQEVISVMDLSTANFPTTGARSEAERLVQQIDPNLTLNQDHYSVPQSTP